MNKIFIIVIPAISEFRGYPRHCPYHFFSAKMALMRLSGFIGSAHNYNTFIRKYVIFVQGMN